MQVISLKDAGWNEHLVAQLSSFGCVGVELRWKYSSGGLFNIINDLRKLFGVSGHTNEWLLAGHDLLQPATRITHYKGIWKSIGIEAKTLSTEDITEWSVKYEDGLRFFGVARFSSIDEKQGLSVWSNQANCWLVYAAEKFRAFDFSLWLANGWGGMSLIPHAHLLTTARKQELVLVRYVEGCSEGVSCIAVGPPRAIPFS